MYQASVAAKDTTGAHVQHARLNTGKQYNTGGVANIDNSATENDCRSLVSYLRSKTANLTDVSKNVQQNKCRKMNPTVSILKKKKAMGSSLRWGKKYQLKRGEVR